MFIAPLAVTLSAAAGALAIFAPTEPSGTSVFREGGNCNIKWTPDTTGQWGTTSIELKTGDNINMIHVKNIAVVNGSDPAVTSYDYPCYAVEPNSAIYFYQFNSPQSNETVWTTRFTIAGPNGETTPPANATQPVGGAAIPWGVGHLEDVSQEDPPTSTGAATGPATVPTSGATNLPVTTAADPQPTTSKKPTSTATSTSPAPTKSAGAVALEYSVNGIVFAAAAVAGSFLI